MEKVTSVNDRKKIRDKLRDKHGAQLVKAPRESNSNAIICLREQRKVLWAEMLETQLASILS